VAFSAHFFAAVECVGNKKANKFRHKQHVRVGSGKKRVRQETAAEMTGQDTGVHRLYTDTNRSEALANRRAGDLCANSTPCTAGIGNQFPCGNAHVPARKSVMDAVAVA